MLYQLEGRYPEYYPRIPDINIAKAYYERTKEIIECLKQELLK